MLLRVALLFLCVFLLFVCIRFCELLFWLESQRLPLQLVDPLALSIQQLKTLLEARGIRHDDLIEKQELVDAVENSGGLTTEEGEVLLQENAIPTSLNFTSERHFLEEVEDSKSNIWLIRVVPNGHHAFPHYPLWNTVAERLSRIGIKTGTFYCPRHSSWCLRQGWKVMPTMILLTPSRSDDGPNITVYEKGRASARSIIDWVYSTLESTVTRITDQDVHDKWASESPVVKILQHTDNGCQVKHLIPAFFSALAVQFVGKVSFAVMDTSQPCKSKPLRSQSDKAKSTIIIKTPEFIHTYGSRKGELFQHEALKLFITTMTPTSNDLFILALTLINYSCIFEIFLSHGSLARRIFKTLWFMAKGNFLICSIWLPLVSLFQISQLRPIVGFVMSLYRRTMNTDTAALLRHDILLLSRFPLLVIATLAISVVILSYLDRRFRLGLISQADIQLPFLDFMPTVEHLVHFDPITWPLYTYRVSEVPDEKWLQRCVSELLASLPTWKFGTCWSTCTEPHTCLGCFPTGSQECPECAICLDNFILGLTVCTLPCGHNFHHACTEAWMSSDCPNRWKCPMCREPIF